MDDREIENVDLTQSHASSARKRKDSYDYMNTVRMLGKRGRKAKNSAKHGIFCIYTTPNASTVSIYGQNIIPL